MPPCGWREEHRLHDVPHAFVIRAVRTMLQRACGTTLAVTVEVTLDLRDAHAPICIMISESGARTRGRGSRYCASIRSRDNLARR